MRSPVELVDLPYVFTQLRLLMPHEFIREARDRAVQLTETQLEGLHRLRLLTPFLRVSRDPRLISRLARTDPGLASQVAHWHPTSIEDLREARTAQRLFAPSEEPFVARRRLRRSAGDIEYYASEYLYSHHQLLSLSVVKGGLPFLKYGSDRRITGINVNRLWRAVAKGRDVERTTLAVALSALEPAYYPSIVRSISFPREEDFARYDGWQRRRRLGFFLKWLDVDAAWIKDAAAGLLHRADSMDPLGEWLDVVREAHPDRWRRLKREARMAMDLRIAAEMFLRYYDSLVHGNRAPPLPGGGAWFQGDFDTRLKPRGRVDRVLTSFGLSPHPSLVLSLEGATERLLFPRVMEMFGIRADPNFISIQDAEGVARDLSPLVAFAVAPHVEGDEEGRYLRLARPLTRLLAVTDAEAVMTTAADRRKRREVWADRLVRTLPEHYRTPSVKDSMLRLVYVDTWHRGGLSFEFAHFTDRQLAEAISKLDKRTRQPSFAERVGQIGKLRSQRGNLETVLGRTSKLDLADQLWPTLETKIRRAERNNAERRIPIVRVLDKATDLARELPRRNLVIPL